MARKKKETIVEESNTTDDLVGRALDKMLPQKEQSSKLKLDEDGVSNNVLDKLLPKKEKKTKKAEDEDVIGSKSGKKDEGWFKKFFG